MSDYTPRQRGPIKPTAHQTQEVDGKIGGAVSRLEPDRGFGFIVAREDQKDYFFHATELIDVEMSQIHIGTDVRFRPMTTPKGPRATEIEVLDD